MQLKGHQFEQSPPLGSTPPKAKSKPHVGYNGNSHSGPQSWAPSPLQVARVTTVKLGIVLNSYRPHLMEISGVTVKGSTHGPWHRPTRGQETGPMAQQKGGPLSPTHRQCLLKGCTDQAAPQATPDLRVPVRMG